MATKRAVWFLLADAKGQAFSGTTADKVRFPIDGDVADLRDAVHTKNPNVLAGIDPAQLIVYSNRAAFEAGNALEVDEQIGDRGARKANALVVVVPDKKDQQSAGDTLVKELTAIHPETQKQLWKSVVRISSTLDFTATGVVVDRTSSHIYLLTNLHLWVDEYFSDFLSEQFTKEVRRLKNILRNTKFAAKRENHGAESSSERPRRKPRTTISAVTDEPDILVEQMQDNAMVEAFKFKLNGNQCWRSSADFDFAIFQIATPEPEKVLLCSCPRSTDIYTTMNVHILGFPAALVDKKFGYSYAIIPAQVTGMDQNRMTLTALSAPGLSGSAIICTHRGVLVGYLGFDSTGDNEQYQSYGFTLQGLPRDLPSQLLRK